MRKVFFVAMALVALSFKPFQQSVVITGTVKDCFVPGQDPGGGIEGLDVRALNPASNSGMVSLLRSLDTLMLVMDRDSATTARWNEEYFQLEDLWKNATALALDSTSATGAFTLTVPSMDSVLVISLNEVDGQPSYYEYKMVGAHSNVSMVLDMSRGTCGLYSDVPNGGQGTIQRTAAGLIFEDDFDRANGAPGSNWEIRGNATFWSIAGNVLKGKPTDATLQQILVASGVFGASRGEMVVQARMRRVGTARATFPGIHARHDAAGSNWFRWVISNSGSAAQDEFRQILAGASTTLHTSSSYAGDNAWQQFKLAVKDGQQQGWRDSVQAVNLTSTALNAVTGRAGLSTGWYTSTSDYHEYDDFSVYKKNTVSMSGLATGYKLRVGTRVAVETGGTATVDLLEGLCPRVNAEVLSASGVVVARHTPSGGVWGGDTYSYTP